MQDNDRFASIRPYNDEEVSPVLDRLTRNAEFLDALVRLRLPRVPASLRPCLRPLVAFVLRRQTRRIHTVKDFQRIVERYMSTMIDSTTTEFSVTGLDNLEPGGAYLFIGNHRDIALDPAFISYALFHYADATARIAIGDNLLTKDYVSDLMRLNKSFIVVRSAKGPRQQLAVLRQLSEYISHSITVDRESVWMAQREGRAKDGWDRTEPAIIKMLCIAKGKDVALADHIRALRIVPVAISYEWDPCDTAKARELQIRKRTGGYAKGEQEDVQSIARSITAQKGAVRVSIGTPLDGDFASVDDVATAIDRQVLAMYSIHPSNIAAHRRLHGEVPRGYEQDPVLPEVERELSRRLEELDEEQRPFLLAMYANPLLNREPAPRA